MGKSFFERLTGAVNFSDNEDKNEEKETSPSFDYAEENTENENGGFEARTVIFSKATRKSAENEEEGQLTIDCWKTKDAVVIQTIVAGVKQDDIDVSISRDMVTIKGKRVKQNPPQKEDYLYQELYWGAFSRSVMLPEEIDIDEADALFKNGILTITLPKLDKNRTEKINLHT